MPTDEEIIAEVKSRLRPKIEEVGRQAAAEFVAIAFHQGLIERATADELLSELGYELATDAGQ